MKERISFDVITVVQTSTGTLRKYSVWLTLL